MFRMLRTALMKLFAMLFVQTFLLTIIHGAIFQEDHQGIGQRIVQTTLRNVQIPSCSDLEDALFHTRGEVQWGEWEILYLTNDTPCSQNSTYKIELNQTCLAMGAIRNGFQEVQFSNISSSCCENRCTIASYEVKMCRNCAPVYVRMVLVPESSSSSSPSKPTFFHKPIAATIEIESYLPIRQLIIWRAVRKWSSSIGKTIVIGQYYATVRRVRGRRYRVIFRFKETFGQEFK